MTADGKTQEFVSLFAGAQRRLYAFIRPQVRSAADADDVMQDTSLVLWRKFDQFQAGSDFVRWACQIARLEVLTQHRHARRRPVHLSDEAAELISRDLLSAVELADERRDALAECFEQLPTPHRSLMRRRYHDSAAIEQIAREARRTESAIYKLLARLHEMLLTCIQAKLARKAVRDER